MPKRIYTIMGATGHIGQVLTEELLKKEPSCKITFFCSSRPIDARILEGTGFDFIPLPARGFSANPFQFLLFLRSIFAAKKIVKQKILDDKSQNAVLFSMGGFVSAGAVLAAKSLNIPVAMLNIDAVPGKANSFLAGYARDIFVQFEKTSNYSPKMSIYVISHIIAYFQW